MGSPKEHGDDASTSREQAAHALLEATNDRQTDTTFIARLSNQLERTSMWSTVDRCIFFVLVSLSFALASLAETTFFLAFEELVPYYDLEVLRYYRFYIAIVVALHVALLGIGWALRSRVPQARGFELLTVGFVSLVPVGVAYYHGLYNNALLTSVIAVAGLGLVLFRRRVVLGALGLSLACITVMATLEQLDHLPYAPLMLRAPFDAHGLHPSYFRGMGLAFLALSVVAVVLFGSVVRRWREANVSLRELRVTDPSTGVGNRRFFLESLERDFSRAIRHGHQLSLILVDVDHLKKVNDHFGHKVGDRALALIATALQDNVRDHDVVGRLGGEEFAVLLVESDLEASCLVAERCRSAIKRLHVKTTAGATQVSASFGIASFPEHPVLRPEDLIRMADRALARAKESGRDSVCSATVESWKTS